MKEIEYSKEANSIRQGIYQHSKKGGRYEFVGIAIHSETLEEMVVYKALYGKGIVWVRPLKMFTEDVDVDGTKTPRFVWIGDK
jgi:cyclomaltodextrinase / maltogenic alpha-amylase / neopullulanase